MKIRKQVYELTLSDFEQFPVWEFALDEECEEDQDELTVRPCNSNPPYNPRDEMMVGKAEFKLADGTKMHGYISIPVPEDIEMGYIQPVIITDQQQVGFWYGIMKPDSNVLSQSYELLCKNAAEVFPLEFTSTVDLVYGPIAGTLDGFMYMYKENGSSKNYIEASVK